MEPFRLQPVLVAPFLEESGHIPVGFEFYKVILCDLQYLRALFRLDQDQEQELRPDPVLFNLREAVLYSAEIIIFFTFFLPVVALY